MREVVTMLILFSLVHLANGQTANIFADGSRWVYHTYESQEPDQKQIHSSGEQDIIHGDTIISTPASRYSNVYTDISQYAYIQGTDVYGCSAIESVHLTLYPHSLNTVSQSLCQGDSILVGNEWISAEG
ncbi:MAG: hypothetical protein M3R25_04325 [Bacteroidota bacterium]|nr:hypothetical protein [Bacteroidota bacterium]